MEPTLQELCHRSLDCHLPKSQAKCSQHMKAWLLAKGNTRHIKSAFCDVNDMDLFQALWSELDVSGKYKPPGGHSAQLGLSPGSCRRFCDTSLQEGSCCKRGL